jgi:hypothetical protein
MRDMAIRARPCSVLPQVSKPTADELAAGLALQMPLRGRHGQRLRVRIMCVTCGAMGIRTPDLLHAIGKGMGSIASRCLDRSTAGDSPAVAQGLRPQENTGRDHVTRPGQSRQPAPAGTGTASGRLEAGLSRTGHGCQASWRTVCAGSALAKRRDHGHPVCRSRTAGAARCRAVASTPTVRCRC